MIVEIAGRPPKHLSEALENHIAKIETIKDVEVTSKKFSEPTQIDKEKDIYSCFAEVEVEVETMFKLTELIFDFMPSSVEVLEPENVSMNSQEA